MIFNPVYTVIKLRKNKDGTVFKTPCAILFYLGGKMKNEKITERSVDFAKWYTDVVKKADLVGKKKNKEIICKKYSLESLKVLEKNELLGYNILK